MGTGRQLLGKAGGLGSIVAGATAGSHWESIPSALGSRPKSARHISYAQPAPLSGGGRRLLCYCLWDRRGLVVGTVQITSVRSCIPRRTTNVPPILPAR